MYVCMYVYIHICVYVRMYACMYVCMSECTYACMSVRMHVHLCMYVNVCECMNHVYLSNYIYIHISRYRKIVPDDLYPLDFKPKQQFIALQHLP